MFLGYWDGKSFFSLDFSLHNEKGKNKKKPFGLSPRQQKKQYVKKREKNSSGYVREKELTIDKISTAISTIKRSIKGVTVDYLLMDSWFFCEAFMNAASKLAVEIIAMAKMAKAKYDYQGKKYTAKELAQLMKKRKKVKWIKNLNMYCAEVEAEYKSKALKLYWSQK